MISNNVTLLIVSNIGDAWLSTPMGVDYVVIGFDMEVQP